MSDILKQWQKDKQGYLNTTPWTEKTTPHTMSWHRVGVDDISPPILNLSRTRG
jgi:hypothetical protein